MIKKFKMLLRAILGERLGKFAFQMIILYSLPTILAFLFFLIYFLIIYPNDALMNLIFS